MTNFAIVLLLIIGINYYFFRCDLSAISYKLRILLGWLNTNLLIEGDAILSSKKLKQ